MSPQQTLRNAAYVLVAGFGLAAMSALPAPAEACRVPNPLTSYSMQILVNGSPLPVYAASGTPYVEALKGREYAVRLTNHTGERVAVALAVDGLNSIDAKHTSSRDARKWILGPYETVTLSGWQTSSGTARRFVFTTEPKSYGAWLGRTNDLGVISAAFFREARLRSQITPELSSPAPAEPMADQRLRRSDAPSANRESQAGGLGRLEKSAAKDELAATGIGREIDHRVMEVEFEEESSPASIISFRYEYRDALVRLGVIPGIDEPIARRERSHGFSDSGFAPDPY